MKLLITAVVILLAIIITGILIQLRQWHEHMLEDVPDDLCCCGEPMEGHSFFEGHEPKSMRAWAIESGQ